MSDVREAPGLSDSAFAVLGAYSWLRSVFRADMARDDCSGGGWPEVRMSSWLLVGIVWLLMLQYPQANQAWGEIAARLPPPPAVPEVSSALRERLLDELDADEYTVRERATWTLARGGVETVQTLAESLAAVGAGEISTEGKVRALQVAQDIYLRLLRWQFDDDALTVRGLLDDIRRSDDALLGPRLDTFHATHGTLMERASIRTLVRLNAVLEFRKVNRYLPGISKQDFPTELPNHIFIGENWLGDDKDLRHVELLMLLGESHFGRSRAIYRIKGCPIPLRAFQDLVAGLPMVMVEERGQARLGIVAQGSQFGDFEDWEITQIYPSSAAAHAGLKMKDRIVRLEGETISSFRDLTVRLEDYKPADVVLLDVLRDQSEAHEIRINMPESLEDYGLTVDPRFTRFVLIKDVTPDSPAAEAGFSPLQRIDRINGQPVGDPDHFRLHMSRLQPGQQLKLNVRELEQIPVTLRGWVGPYR